MNSLNRSQRLAVWLISLTGLVDAIGLVASPLQFDPVWSGWVLLVTIAVGLVFGSRLQRLSLSPTYKHLITNLGLLFLFSPLALVFSYLVASHSGASLDHYLVSLDNSLGFNWQAYHAFFLQNDYLRFFSLLFYLLVPALPVVCLIALTQRKAFDTAANGVAALMLSALICIGISALIPSYGAVSFYQPPAEVYQGFNILIDHDYMRQVIALREGREVNIRLWQPMAVIAFPSYHACLAMLTILLSWQLRGWFGWMLGMNLAGLLVIPVEGGHHLIDVLTGLLIGICTYLFLTLVSHPRTGHGVCH